jgi:hypothetical protein
VQSQKEETFVNHIEIVQRALEVTARNRALWVLGFIWALVGGCGGGGGGSAGSGFSSDGGGGGAALPQALEPLRDRLAAVTPEQWVGLAVALGCLALFLAVVMTVARYVLQAGIFRSLDHLAAFGRRPTVAGGWREGWHRRTWRPLLQNLLVDIPLAVLTILALLPAILPLIVVLAAEGGGGLGGAAAVFAGCYCCLWLVAVVVVANVVGVLKHLWWRAALLDDEGFLTAMGTGWRLARANVRDLFGMWLVMVLAGVVWAVAYVMLVIAFGVLAALVAGGPALLLYRATEGLLWPLVWGVPAGVLAFAAPLVLASGLYLVFQASVWTQVYRHLAGPPRQEAPAWPQPEDGDDRTWEEDTGNRPWPEEGLDQA